MSPKNQSLRFVTPFIGLDLDEKETVQNSESLLGRNVENLCVQDGEDPVPPVRGKSLEGVRRRPGTETSSRPSGFRNSHSPYPVPTSGSSPVVPCLLRTLVSAVREREGRPRSLGWKELTQKRKMTVRFPSVYHPPVSGRHRRGVTRLDGETQEVPCISGPEARRLSRTGRVPDPRSTDEVSLSLGLWSRLWVNILDLFFFVW